MMRAACLARRWVAAAGLLLAGTGAQAACSVSSGALSFGAYQPLSFQGELASPAVDSTGTITVNCSVLLLCLNPTSYSIRIGAGSSGSIAARAMPGQAAAVDSAMAYNLYTDASRTAVWGDGVTGGTVTGSFGNGCGTRSHTVYGRVPGGQNSLRPGTYRETLTVTLEYNP